MKKNHPGPTRMIVAQNLRRLRAERGLSQDALAFEAEMNRTYVGGVERGERNVSLDNIARLAKALGIEPWELLLHKD